MELDPFSLVAERLEQQTSLNRLEARGTLRIALKGAGVDSKSFTFTELEAVFAKIMPGELARCGVADTDAICDAVLKSLPTGAFDAARDSATMRDAIMRRIASS